jgi:hypothetical protein
MQLALAATWARSGKHARATNDVEAVLKAAPVMPLIFYDAACAYALASEAAAKDTSVPETDRRVLAQRHAARSVELLRQAVAVGYDDAEHMKRDTDLDSLRARADFQELLRQLAEKVKPRPP